MKRLLTGLLTVAALMPAVPAVAQDGDRPSFLNRIFGGDTADTSNLRATIWVDPDGCEHWVMDTGIEGFMSAHIGRDGKPVCRGDIVQNGACKTLDGAAIFDVGSARVSASARDELSAYFGTIAGRDIIVGGHTDSTGSTKANLDLSLRRAMAVAAIARAAGVNAEARGFGEQVPIASNDTPEGRAQNRRVELTCL